MPRASRSKVQVEIEKDGTCWALFKSGFSSLGSAEEWIIENIIKYGGVKLRAVRVSGTFHKQTKVVKR